MPERNVSRQLYRQATRRMSIQVNPESRHHQTEFTTLILPHLQTALNQFRDVAGVVYLLACAMVLLVNRSRI